MGGVLGVTDERTLTPEGRDVVAKDFVLRNEEPLPPWSGSTSATSSPPYFNRESPTLLGIRQKVMRAMLGRDSCEILVTADSKGSNYQGAVISWPEQLRRMLDARDGFVQADDGIMDPRWSLTGMSIAPTTTIGVQPTTLGSGSTKRASFAGTVGSNGGTLFARIPGGGSATLTINGTSQSVTIPSGTGFQEIPLGALPGGALTIAIESTADLYVEGIRFSYATPGLRVSNPARPSSSAADWSPGSSNGRWASVVAGPASTPDVIISALGTNEITNLTAVTTYYDALAARGVPVIVVFPGGLGGSRTRPEAEALATRLYSIAQTRDWVLVNFEQVIGTYTQALAHLLMLDALHENTRAAQLEALAVHALLSGGVA